MRGPVLLGPIVSEGCSIVESSCEGFSIIIVRHPLVRCSLLVHLTKGHHTREHRSH